MVSSERASERTMPFPMLISLGRANKRQGQSGPQAHRGRALATFLHSWALFLRSCTSTHRRRHRVFRAPAIRADTLFVWTQNMRAPREINLAWPRASIGPMSAFVLSDRSDTQNLLCCIPTVCRKIRTAISLILKYEHLYGKKFVQLDNIYDMNKSLFKNLTLVQLIYFSSKKGQMCWLILHETKWIREGKYNIFEEQFKRDSHCQKIRKSKTRC